VQVEQCVKLSARCCTVYYLNQVLLPCCVRSTAAPAIEWHAVRNDSHSGSDQWSKTLTPKAKAVRLPGRVSVPAILVLVLAFTCELIGIPDWPCPLSAPTVLLSTWRLYSLLLAGLPALEYTWSTLVAALSTLVAALAAWGIPLSDLPGLVPQALPWPLVLWRTCVIGHV